jgi:peptidoglycan-associated lipoprotein
MRMRIRSVSSAVVLGLALASLVVGACGTKKPPVARPLPPPPPVTTPDAPPAPPPAAPIRDAPLVPAPAVVEDPMITRSIDDLNRDSPMRPVFFDYDSADLSAGARAVLDANAGTLKTYPSWVITIEGHCDERGTAEYNLSLGERRAVSAQSYLVSLGNPADRLRTVSYGKEFPFDPGHDEPAWAKNRRAHLVITAK